MRFNMKRRVRRIRLGVDEPDLAIDAREGVPAIGARPVSQFPVAVRATDQCLNIHVDVSGDGELGCVSSWSSCGTLRRVRICLVKKSER